MAKDQRQPGKPPRQYERWSDGRTQKEIAEQLGCSQQTVSRIKRGWTPGVGLRIRLKRLAGVPLSAWPGRKPGDPTDKDLSPDSPRGAA